MSVSAPEDVTNNDILNRMNEFFAELKTDRQRIGRLEESEKKTEDKLNDMDARVNMLEQSKLNARMEVSGLACERNGERINLKKQFMEYARKANLEVAENEVMNVFTVTRPQRGELVTAMIVVFAHEEIKNRIMRQKIINDKGKRVTVYFGNVLTAHNRRIFMEARKLMREKKIFKTWTVGGDVFIAKEEGDHKIKITTLTQLEHVVSYTHDAANESDQGEESMGDDDGGD